MSIFALHENYANAKEDCEFGTKYGHLESSSSDLTTARCMAPVELQEQNGRNYNLTSGSYTPVDSEVDAHSNEHQQRIAVLEPHVFLRECIRRGMEDKFPYKFDTFANIDALERDLQLSSIRLIILSCCGANEPESGSGRASIERLAAVAPKTPIVVLASRHDANLMRLALEIGAKGYLLTSMGFDLAIEAVRFVLAGGTYVPVDILVAAATARVASVSTDQPTITAREMLVIRAIKQGKPNKVIAYELNLCESTVKVHVRHIMKKLGAKNRTAVAMKAGEMLIGPP